MSDAALRQVRKKRIRCADPFGCKIKNEKLNALYFVALQAAGTYVQSLVCAIHITSDLFQVGFPHFI